jgi:murein DD-endopeptidase MepM/ murein hydrolase activator NlpD
MRKFARTLASAVIIGSLALQSSAVHAGDGSWTWPIVDGRPAGDSGLFDAPDSPYGRGHRGIDVPALVGADVLAVAPGVVTFAGSVAGTGIVTIDHGGERSTYQPVSAAVAKGDRVEAGDVLGTLQAGPGHCTTPCLHLGRIDDATKGAVAEGSDYLDPLERLPVRSNVRLVDPDEPPPVPPLGPSGAGILQPPVGGPITSPFGARDHPVTGATKLHDGTDFGAGCGTPVRAAAEGVVGKVGRAKGYGNRVTIRHANGLETLYGHLSRIDVRAGEKVSASTTVGRVGSTGLSTGCHLHFGVYADSRAVDPTGYL